MPVDFRGRGAQPDLILRDDDRGPRRRMSPVEASASVPAVSRLTSTEGTDPLEPSFGQRSGGGPEGLFPLRGHAAVHELMEGEPRWLRLQPRAGTWRIRSAK